MSSLKELNDFTTKNVDYEISKLKKELEEIRKFKSDFPGTPDEWKDTAIFLSESKLKEYAKTLAAQQLDLAIWPLDYIDWDKAVESIKKEYKMVMLDDIEYWIVEKSLSDSIETRFTESWITKKALDKEKLIEIRKLAKEYRGQ